MYLLNGSWGLLCNILSNGALFLRQARQLRSSRVPNLSISRRRPILWRAGTEAKCLDHGGQRSRPARLSNRDRKDAGAARHQSVQLVLSGSHPRDVRPPKPAVVEHLSSGSALLLGVTGCTSISSSASSGSSPACTIGPSPIGIGPTPPSGPFRLRSGIRPVCCSTVAAQWQRQWRSRAVDQSGDCRLQRLPADRLL